MSALLYKWGKHTVMCCSNLAIIKCNASINTSINGHSLLNLAIFVLFELPIIIWSHALSVLIMYLSYI